MTELLKYKNGLRVVVNTVRGVRSVASGFWVGVGSAYEDEKINGLSHFTEHVTFKGTDAHDAFAIAHEFESYGAAFNAFTSKECTCYYVKSIDEYAENCFSLLGEILLRSVYADAELDKERKVVIEEINMVEDTPEDICYDELAAAAYGNESLGRTILGPIKNVRGFKHSDVAKFTDEFYTAGNIVIAFAGNVTADNADRLVKKYVLPYIKAGNRAKLYATPNPNARECKMRIKDFEQANLALYFPSVSAYSPEANVCALTSVAFGGGMSSRLFQSVRERRGLAYSVYSSPSAYTKTGAFNIFLNISEENTDKALTAVREEIDALLQSGLTDEELDRSKVQLKSSLVFAGENVQSIMSSCGKVMLGNNELFDFDKKIALIDAVTKEDVLSYVRRTFDYAKMNAAYVGKKTKADILGKF